MSRVFFCSEKWLKVPSGRHRSQKELFDLLQGLPPLPVRPALGGGVLPQVEGTDDAGAGAAGPGRGQSGPNCVMMGKKAFQETSFQFLTRFFFLKDGSGNCFMEKNSSLLLSISFHLLCLYVRSADPQWIPILVLLLDASIKSQSFLEENKFSFFPSLYYYCIPLKKIYPACLFCVWREERERERLSLPVVVAQRKIQFARILVSESVLPRCPQLRGNFWSQDSFQPACYQVTRTSAFFQTFNAAPTLNSQEKKYRKVRLLQVRKMKL